MPPRRAAAPAAERLNAGLLSGRVVSAHGRSFVVETDRGRLRCAVRGRRADIVCGDMVQVRATGSGTGVVEAVAPRKSLLARADAFHHKAIAANLDLLVVVMAAEPEFSLDLVQRCLLAAEIQDLGALILVNKADLPQHAAAMARLAPLAAIGYEVLGLSAHGDISALRLHLAGKTTLMVGQSGMGKSSLLNALVPEANAHVAEISRVLGSGRHTTTHTALYALDAHSALIDSPGLQEFALAQYAPAELERAFPDFRPYLGQCRYRDCRHRGEPGCALAAAEEAGRLWPARRRLLQRLQDELDFAQRKH